MSKDTIYREDAIKVINLRARIPHDVASAQYASMAINAIRSVPSADRPREWIPCSERLPVNDDWVIISILDENGDTPFRYSDFGWYLEAAKCWIVEAEQRTDVIAWMPLPKPYRERSK